MEYMNKTNIILDTDIGFDPDDCVALLLALNSPEIDIKLIITNKDADGNSYNLVKRILKAKKREDIKLFQGFLRPFYAVKNLKDAKLNEEEISILQALDEVIQNEDKIYYICIASLRNLANYLRFYEEKNNNLDDLRMNLNLVQMGGNENRRESNFTMDYGAAQYVFSRKLKTTLVTSEITNNPEILVWEESDFYEKVYKSPVEEHKILMENINQFFSIYPAFFLHDPLTIASLIDESIFEFRYGSVEFLENGFNKYHFAENNNIYENNHVRISVKADYNKFLNLINSRIFK
ncbi:MAG: nucleoside hydrolase [Promethearchaeota archaeon]